MSGGPIRLAVVGGNRGGAFQGILRTDPDKVAFAAACDLDEGVLARWRETYPDIRTYTRYEDLLEAGCADAVIIATPVALHADQAVAALDAGLHVLSEVYAAATIEDCWRLVEAVERSGRVYMMAENYCYTRANMMVLHLVEEGLFGDLTYAEGAYIHDCRGLMFAPDGELTWRGASRTVPGTGNGYPTHSLGPVAWWLGIGKRDHLATTATFVTRSEGAWRYVRERFGADHPLASPEAMPVGDSATTVITTESGAVIVLRVDTNSARPHNMVHYALQGTRGAYVSERWHGESPLVWLDGVSAGDSPSGAAEWQPLWELSDAHEHPRWRAEGAEAMSAGHGGGDYFVIRDFVDAIRAGAGPPVDVYDSVTWSSIVPLSADSVARGGAPVAVPRFRREGGPPPPIGHG